MNRRAPWLLAALAAVGAALACSNDPAGDGPPAHGSGGQNAPSGGSGGENPTGGNPTGGSASVASGGSSFGGDGASGGQSTTSGGSGGALENGWSLVWSDEFEGDSIDTSKWEHEVNCWGGGNNEDQCYVTDAKNAFVEEGLLHIVALADNPSGPEGGGSGSDAIVSKGHSSARIRTKNKGDFKYGRIEASLKLPFGQGLWPAFWMLPTDEVYGGWASSGEIDIMEAVNLNPSNEVHGTLHYGGVWPDNTSSGQSTSPSSNAWENFHEYAVEWEEGEVRWFLGGELYQTQTEWFSAAAEFPAPFDERFHIILNVAVGGNWPGPPDASTTFPQQMVVDYVRVFECTRDPETGHGCGG